MSGGADPLNVCCSLRMNLQKSVSVPMELAFNADAISFDRNTTQALPHMADDLGPYVADLTMAPRRRPIELFQSHIDGAQAVPGSHCLHHLADRRYAKVIPPPSIDAQALSHWRCEQGAPAVKAGYLAVWVRPWAGSKVGSGGFRIFEARRMAAQEETTYSTEKTNRRGLT